MKVTGGKNPKMERKSTMMGVYGKPDKISSSGKSNSAKDVSRNPNQTGPSIKKKMG